MKQFILILLIISLSINIFQYISKPEIITKTTIDTVYVQLPVETIYKDNIITKYVNVKDTTEINKLRDSLQTFEQFVIELKKQLDEGKVYTLHDTTKFESGDSIQTICKFWPLNSIQYSFFPRPDKVIIVTNDNYILKKWSLIPSVGIGTLVNNKNFKNSYYLLVDIGVKHYTTFYQFEYGKSISDGSTLLGLKYGKEF